MRKLKTSTRHHLDLPQILNQIYIYYLHLPKPLDLAMVLEFVESQRGKPKLKHEGYLYCLLRENDGLKTWRRDKRQCKAIATTFDDNVFTTRLNSINQTPKNTKKYDYPRKANLWVLIIAYVRLSQGFVFPFSPPHPITWGHGALLFPKFTLIT